jgi:membrane protein DedA with SNARE-associated domain
MSEWITNLVESTGYAGIAILMLVENLFPPIPSELIMPLAGFAAARGDLDLVPTCLAGVAGSMLGAAGWYYAGRWLGSERLKRLARRFGRWLTVTPADIDGANRWFARHGGIAVFGGRLVPAVRTLISVPAGIAAMSAPRFLLYSIGGTALWTAALGGAGYALEARFTAVASYLNPVSNVVVGLLAAWYVWRVIAFNEPHPDSKQTPA